MNEAQGVGKDKAAKGHPAWNLIYAQLTNLIIVPGHAIFVGHKKAHATRIECWKGTFQEGYRGNDEARLYTEHVKAGVDALATDPKALLLFSGGQTREEVGPFSEAQSYWYLAEACDWFCHLKVRERALTEEYARDSFENMLFSIYRFRQCTGILPTRITVYGFEFKAERYQMHFTALKNEADALGLKGIKDAFAYQGINDPPYYRLHGFVGKPGSGSFEGEAKARADFAACPLGDSGDLLGKRNVRDPFRRGNPYR